MERFLTVGHGTKASCNLPDFVKVWMLLGADRLTHHE
jgi:hypothetical protein